MLDRLSRDGFPEITRSDSLWVAHSNDAHFATLEWRFPGRQLLADAEFRNHGFVTLGIVFLEVVQQATALADQHEKAAARAVVFLVRLEVLRQLANPFAQQRDLDFWASRVACVGSVLVNEGFLLLSG